MRKIALFLAFMLLVSSIYASASTIEKMNSNKALTKFSRGVTNIVSSPGEYATQTPTAMEQSPDYLTGFLMTIGRGTGYMLLRATSGIYDVVTAPFPGPTNYGPIMKPETIFDKAADSVTK
ncbi:MAG TPA: exosortase system-associated protein, TIGR04073 family [Candidatus Omnitrophota bacterium]|nr:exosortase system-associated protein, TIGR04073 family [Candidatus Omnitrophota bacterium]HRY85481.1 exosortase system-associated protein, TIGR04073 family [Candidatus Omnitrophota bacterium]